jgi:rubredoxin
MFYDHQAKPLVHAENAGSKNEPQLQKGKMEFVHQCRHCLTVYDDAVGEPGNGIPAGTPFDQLPGGYVCSLCDAPAADFVRLEKSLLALEPV